VEPNSEANLLTRTINLSATVALIRESLGVVSVLENSLGIMFPSMESLSTKTVSSAAVVEGDWSCLVSSRSMAGLFVNPASANKLAIGCEETCYVGS